MSSSSITGNRSGTCAWFTHSLKSAATFGLNLASGLLQGMASTSKKVLKVAGPIFLVLASSQKALALDTRSIDPVVPFNSGGELDTAWPALSSLNEIQASEALPLRQLESTLQDLSKDVKEISSRLGTSAEQFSHFRKAFLDLLTQFINLKIPPNSTIDEIYEKAKNIITPYVVNDYKLNIFRDFKFFKQCKNMSQTNTLYSMIFELLTDPEVKKLISDNPNAVDDLNKAIDRYEDLFYKLIEG